MTKEQEEAIEVLKKCWVITTEHLLDEENKKVKEAIETVLSMLEEKDEQIAEEQNAVEQIYADYQDLGREKWKADEAILFLTERLENSISKQKEKDKIIDLMAEFIAQTEIDELICKDIEHCIADDEYSNCYKCIEQYFENKVKEK